MHPNLLESPNLILKKIKQLIYTRFNIALDYQLFKISEEQILHYLASYDCITIPNILRSSSLKRRVEFLSGRICALTAMKLYGVKKAQQLLIKSDSSPMWPHNIVGSISHSKNIAIAIVGDNDKYSGIGIDIEQIPKNNTATELMPKIISSNELTNFHNLNLDTQQLFSIVFSGKEALFKAVYPQVNKYFYFNDVKCINILPEYDQWSMMLTKTLSKKHYAGKIYCGLYFIGYEYIISIVILSQ